MSAESSFDASSGPGDQPAREPEPHQRESRPFLGIRFECCRTYQRIYRNQAKTAYTGQCPKCGARVRVPIGSGGSSGRFYQAR